MRVVEKIEEVENNTGISLIKECKISVSIFLNSLTIINFGTPVIKKCSIETYGKEPIFYILDIKQLIIEFLETGFCDVDIELGRMIIREVQNKDEINFFLDNSKSLKKKEKYNRKEISKIMLESKVIVCESYYTDDYLWDAESNYGKGKEEDKYAMAKNVFESSKGVTFFLAEETENEMIFSYSRYHYYTANVIIDKNSNLWI